MIPLDEDEQLRKDEQMKMRMINNLVTTSAATCSMLVSDNQMQGTCFFCSLLQGTFFTLVDDLELKKTEERS